jgi:adenosylhomocysteine nucleosidase
LITGPALRRLAHVISIACAAACAAPRPAPRVVVMISANAEWTPVVARFARAEIHATPYGDFVVTKLGDRDVVLFHGGYGKVAAAGSTQYAIDRWRPRLVINLGTCGAFGHGLAVGDIVLATETIIYDLVEQMGDPDEPIRDYRTRLDTAKWPARLRTRVHAEAIASGDRDLVAAELPALRAKYDAAAGDWESGAIAYVAARNRVPAIVLRGVTDVVDARGDATYGDAAAWQRAAATMMMTLVELAADALPELVP